MSDLDRVSSTFVEARVPWLPVYARWIDTASVDFDTPLRLAALVWQESAGGYSATRIHTTSGFKNLWTYAPQRLYRYEPGFYRRYLAGKDEWAAAPGVDSEVHARRISASYGICQIMYPTARMLGMGPDEPVEKLFDPEYNLQLAAKFLRHHRSLGKSWKDTWASYNGGGNPAYVESITKHFTDLQAACR